MPDAPNLADLRKNYTHGGLAEADSGEDPLALFAAWFDAAVSARLPEPNAVTVATVGPDGRPQARIVLLKGFDERGFVFYSNYDSLKGQALAANPFAALCFLWHDFERQVRIEGGCTRVSAGESDAYFQARPRMSRLGAWASIQSDVVATREELDANLKAAEAKFPGEVPRPPHWGGYRVEPDSIEFWQGRPSRMHDRLRFRRAEHRMGWVRERLSP